MPGDLAFINLKELFRVFIIYAHLIAFAASIFLVLYEDWQILINKNLNFSRLKVVHSALFVALMALAITGSGIIALDTGFDPKIILNSEKLMAKISVILVLITNGYLLNNIALPLLNTPPPRRLGATVTLCLLGSISTTSWLYAAFLGVAKPLTPHLGFTGFIMLYAICLLFAALTALTLFRNRLKYLLNNYVGL